MKEKYFSLLREVVKPACYTGNEFNITKKNWDDNLFKIALVFPDAYVVGESSLSLKILYDILNKNPHFAAERFFTPSLDFENKLLENNIPLLSAENFKPLKDFDIIGFTIQHEFTYTNILSVLNLSGLKFKAAERGEDDPILCAGGPGVYNPEPIAPIFDFFFIGEAENSINDLFALIKKLKEEGKAKSQILKTISDYDGIYVPQFYVFEYDNEGRIKSVTPDGAKKIKKQIVNDFDALAPPSRPLVPYVETIHDRAAVEIFRGCTRGCRFCQAGMIYRPVRERSLDNVFSYAVAAIKNTGFEEISFVSLNCADYSNIAPLIIRVKNELKNISVSLPSLRVDCFTEELAFALSLGKRSSLTFAPEAGTQKMRDRINKVATEEDILNTAFIAKKYGWKLMKLYFMIGLPGEETEDLDGIIDLVRKVLKETGLNLNISIATFVPKPHTPFQWYGQITMDETQEKIMYLRKHLRHGRIKLSFHNARQSLTEAALARGDRKIFEVINKAFEAGCRFDGWSDNFNFDKWVSAFNSCGLDMNFYAERTIGYDEITPWDHISCGVKKEFLIDEDIKAKQNAVSYDCRFDKCLNCGVCAELNVENILKEKVKADAPTIKTIIDSSEWTFGYRLKYSKENDLKFIGHLDILRLLMRAVKRANLPAAYRGKFHPRMRISASHPLGMFYTSLCEYLDLELNENIKEDDLKQILERELPAGLKILNIKRISNQAPSLMRIFKEVDYEVILKNNIENINEKVKEILDLKTVFLDRKAKTIDLKSVLKDIKHNNGGKNNLLITLKLSDLGGIKPTDVLGMLGIDNSEIEEIKRIEFR